MGKTPIYGFGYPDVGDPIRNTRAAWIAMVTAIETALQSKGVAAANASDVLAVSGRVSVIENRDYSEVYQTVAQSIPANTWTGLLFGGEHADTNNLHSNTSASTRVTIANAGTYSFVGTVMMVAPATACRFGAQVRVNGTALGNASGFTWAPTGSIDLSVTTPTFIRKLNAGDYIELFAIQSSSAAVNTSIHSDCASTLTVQQIA